jgi:hypothetical protein
MAGRYTGSYLDKLNDWRVAAIQADIGRASLVIRIRITTISRFDHFALYSQAKVPPSALHGVAAGLARRGLVPCTGALLTLDNSENARQPIEL